MAIKPKQKKKEPKAAEKHVWGRVRESKQRTETTVGPCGNKYIKTRKGQLECLWCLMAAR